MAKEPDKTEYREVTKDSPPPKPEPKPDYSKKG